MVSHFNSKINKYNMFTSRIPSCVQSIKKMRNQKTFTKSIWLNKYTVNLCRIVI